MKRIDTKIFKIRDFENEKDLNERLRMCLIQPEFFQYLTDAEMRHFDYLYQTFAMVHSARNLLVEPHEIIKNAIPDISSNKAQQLVNDMYEVFEFGSDKNIRKQIAAQMQWKLAEKAYNAAANAQDYDYASKILKRATDLEGLEKIRELEAKQARKIPKRIILSSNPEVLEKQQERHANDDESTD